MKKNYLTVTSEYKINHALFVLPTFQTHIYCRKLICWTVLDLNKMIKTIYYCIRKWN